MNRTWFAVGAALVILLVGVPPISQAAARMLSPSAPAIAVTPAPPPVTGVTPCDEQNAVVAAAKNAINDKWGVAAVRAKELGASDKDINAAKAILLSSDPPQKREADLVTLYRNSSLKNLAVSDLGKVYAVVDARMAYEDALKNAAAACPIMYGPGTGEGGPLVPDPTQGADARSNAAAPVAPPASGQVMVVPNGAPATGDGTLSG